jgi:hypothetical protein
LKGRAAAVCCVCTQVRAGPVSRGPCQLTLGDCGMTSSQGQKKKAQADFKQGCRYLQDASCARMKKKSQD